MKKVRPRGECLPAQNATMRGLFRIVHGWRPPSLIESSCVPKKTHERWSVGRGFIHKMEAELLVGAGGGFDGLFAVGNAHLHPFLECGDLCVLQLHALAL